MVGVGHAVPAGSAAAAEVQCLAVLLPRLAAAMDDLSPCARERWAPGKKEAASKFDLQCTRDEDGEMTLQEKEKEQPHLSPSRRRGDAPSKVKIKVHAEPVFRRLRQLWPAATPAMSLSPVPLDGWREVASPGKGGATMFFAGGLMMKTMSEAEESFFKKLLPAYCERVSDPALPESLLPRILAWVVLSYRTQVGLCTRRFLVMHNVLASKEPIPTVFDIKGSTFGREATVSEDASGGGDAATGGVVIYKDNDLKGRKVVPASPDFRGHLLKSLEADTQLLQAHSVIDYSLLLGIMPGKDTPLSPPTLGLVVPGKEETYYMGVIDILQPYTSLKKFETVFKGLVADDDTMSVIPPDRYASRFMAAVADLVEDGTKK